MFFIIQFITFLAASGLNTTNDSAKKVVHVKDIPSQSYHRMYLKSLIGRYYTIFHIR